MTGRLTRSLTWPLLAVLGIGIGLSAAYARHRGAPHADEDAARAVAAAAALVLMLTPCARRLGSRHRERATARQARRVVPIRGAGAPGAEAARLAERVAACESRLAALSAGVRAAHEAAGLTAPDLPAGDPPPRPRRLKVVGDDSTLPLPTIVALCAALARSLGAVAALPLLAHSQG